MNCMFEGHLFSIFTILRLLYVIYMSATEITRCFNNNEVSSIPFKRNSFSTQEKIPICIHFDLRFNLLGCIHIKLAGQKTAKTVINWILVRKYDYLALKISNRKILLSGLLSVWYRPKYRWNICTYIRPTSCQKVLERQLEDLAWMSKLKNYSTLIQ